MGRKKSATTIRAIEMLNSGYTPKTVADVLDISRQRVYQIKQQMKKNPPPAPVRKAPAKPRTLLGRIAALFA